MSITFTAIDPEAIPEKTRKHREGPNTTIEAFLAANVPAAKVTNPEGRTGKSVYTSLMKAAKDRGVEVRIVGEDVFLKREIQIER